MLSGRPPFWSTNKKKMMENIVNKPVKMPEHFSVEARNLLSGILERDPAKRLGSSEEDAIAIKRHPWFTKIDWDLLYKKRIVPPFKPTVSGPDDTRNIDILFLNEIPRDSNVGELSPSAKI
jgi:serine/threonine protein kinase